MLRAARSAIFQAHSDDDVDPANLGAQGRQRKPANHDVMSRDVLQFAGRFAKEMMVIGCIGVKV